MYTFRRNSNSLFAGMFFMIITMGMSVSAQNNSRSGSLNAINTAVPFVSITPDSRAGALGDVGVASTPDLNSQHWNLAKYLFIKERSGVSLSYLPWLRSVVPDMNVAYLSAYHKFSDKQVLSGSLRYFSLGKIVFTNTEGEIQGRYTPAEMAADIGYSRLLSDKFSAGLTFRFIHSNLASGQLVEGDEANAGVAFAADLGFYGQDEFTVMEKSIDYAWGITLTNLGTPVSYADDDSNIPIPSALRFGGRLGYDIDDNNQISLMLDFSKLLVPTSPIMEGDSIIRGYDTPNSIVQGIFRSFYDAPGISYSDGSFSSGFREEMAEINIGTGIEYWYRGQFAARAGYFHQAAVKGNKKYLSVGIGLKLSMFQLDFAYLVPVNGVDSPLANTLRFTIGFVFGD